MRQCEMVVLLVMAIVFVALGVCAAEKADVSGVVRANYYGDARKASISQVRFNFYVPMATDTYLFVRVEPNQYNLDSENWLKLAFMSRGKLTIGRMPLLEGYSLPAPQNLYTVSWPHIPAGFYGYGAQLKVGNLAILEISSSPDGIATKNNWDRSQVSLRLAKGNANIILRYDDNHNSQMIVSGERGIANVGTLLRAAFYARHDGGIEKSGGYIFAERAFGKALGIHIQTDFAKDTDTINTIGLRAHNEKGFVILDYEMSPSRSRMLISVVVPF
ncbi:MAG: hypothetical protein PHU42_04050 [Patescibacteria group bacterium]|nr:hypothetical protein [Patescibacteria group bacterium]